jgi:stearoyl-CoA desaturase (Delta-9 desaturase)
LLEAGGIMKHITLRIPFVLLHLSGLLIFLYPISLPLFILCLGSTYIRLFGITAGFHRYFSHKTFQTGRKFQFILALLGTFSAQKGPLWWAAKHRQHHRFSDTNRDIHSPLKQGFWYAHVGWLFKKKSRHTAEQYITDFIQYPELRWIDKNYHLITVIYALLIAGIGQLLSMFAPGLNINSINALVWGFSISTILLYHLTFSINSIMHVFGRRPYNTPDTSKNNVILGILTLGEGWHNNHHRYPRSQRQGFVWWQIDLTHIVLMICKKLGIIWKVNEPSESILKEGAYI